MKIFTTLIFLLIFSTLNIKAQCYSRKGIMNEACATMTIFTPPAYDFSIGFSNNNIMKFDVNHITQDEIVYGGSIGVRPRNIKKIGPEDGSANVFLGYNLAGCIIIGASAGITHVTDYAFEDEQGEAKFKTGYKGNIGMAIKFITTYTSRPITFGAYGSNAGIGMTIGTIF